MTKVNHDNLGIMEGPHDTIHAITATQKTVDGFSGKLWGHPAFSITVPTAAAKARERPFQTEWEAHRMAFCVPAYNVSTLDLTCRQEKAAKYDDIEKVVKQALKGVLGCGENQVVFCDLNSDAHSPILDDGLVLLSRTTL